MSALSLAGCRSNEITVTPCPPARQPWSPSTPAEVTVAAPTLGFPSSSPHILISLQDEELVRGGPAVFISGHPSLAHSTCPINLSRRNSCKAAKSPPLFSRAYLCNQGQSYGLYTHMSKHVPSSPHNLPMPDWGVQLPSSKGHLKEVIQMDVYIL